MNYGLSYLGSKSKIVNDICRIFPKSENFYDLFGGGGSVTHFMASRRKNDFKNFFYNDIRKGLPDFLKDCIDGKYKNYKIPWVSREEFLKKKENDFFIKCIWSFGNNGRSYIFGKEIESEKKSLHNAVVFNEFDDFSKKFFGFEKFRDGYTIEQKRLFVKRRVGELSKNRIDLEQLEQLQQLERLERLERLEQLERLEITNLDYRDVKIKNNSVIYCDIPYQGTTEYDKNKTFNHKDFFDWVKNQDQPLFVSEYKIEEDFLRCIWSKKIRQTLRVSSKKETVEKLYCNEIAFKMIRGLKNANK